MNKTIKIKSKNQSYDIIIKNNILLKEILKKKLSNEKTIIIIDSKISYLVNGLNNNKNLNIIKISAGEKIKSFRYYEMICSKILRSKINRASYIIAIGGGTIGDLGGFIASTLLRGIRLILMPTTLLSQVDSSIGGKNGINSKYGKNLIGTFYSPSLVIIDPTLLQSLPKREIKSGYAEILKHALIKDHLFYNWLTKNYKKIINLESIYISRAIIKSINIKAFFVQRDEKENLIDSNSRAMLNFGHTFGHALESMNNYSSKLNHGEAISIGMSLAMKISNKINHISDKEYNTFLLHLKNVNLPIYDKKINDDRFFNLMINDKKNTNNRINLILLEKIGKAFFKRELTKKYIKNILK